MGVFKRWRPSYIRSLSFVAVGMEDKLVNGDIGGGSHDLFCVSLDPITISRWYLLAEHISRDTSVDQGGSKFRKLDSDSIVRMTRQPHKFVLDAENNRPRIHIHPVVCNEVCRVVNRSVASATSKPSNLLVSTGVYAPARGVVSPGDSASYSIDSRSRGPEHGIQSHIGEFSGSRPRDRPWSWPEPRWKPVRMMCSCGAERLTNA